MKRNYLLFLAFTLMLGFSACSDDKDTPGEEDGLENYIKVEGTKFPIQLAYSNMLVDDRGVGREVGVAVNFMALDANPEKPRTFQLVFLGDFPYGELVDGEYTINSTTRPIITYQTNFYLGWRDAAGELQMKGYKDITEGSFKVEHTGTNQTSGKKVHTVSFRLKPKGYDDWVEGKCSGTFSGIYPY